MECQQQAENMEVYMKDALYRIILLLNVFLLNQKVLDLMLSKSGFY